MYIDGVPTLELTPDRIVTVARSLIREHGLSGFSMRKLAAALDVNPMTIYLASTTRTHSSSGRRRAGGVQGTTGGRHVERQVRRSPSDSGTT